MLLLDFTQLMIANLHAQLGLQNIREVEPDLLKHMILNTLRSIRVKFGPEYGDIVIACDKRSWRKDVYPYYKANRAKAKAKSDLDWNAIFKVFDEMKEDLKAYFPYRVIEVEGAEADDIIGTLVHSFGSVGLSLGETILIISSDKDYSQLHSYANVKQYDPIKKTYVQPKVTPREYLLEHIIKGDSGDGVPNILSDDDTFVVEGKRQKPMTAKRLEECKDLIAPIVDWDNIPESFEITPTHRRYMRNLQLIDLSRTPEAIKKDVLAKYDEQAGKDRKHVFNYLMKHRMRNLMDSVGDF